MGLARLQRARRHESALLSAAAVALGLAACGGSSSTPASHGATSTGSPSGSSAPSTTSSASSSSTSSASAASGQRIFASAGCGGCHTLAAAHSTGTTGPNLDQLKPSDAEVANQVANGGGGMPSFAGKLSQAQIDAVAKFVSSAAR